MNTNMNKHHKINHKPFIKQNETWSWCRIQNTKENIAFCEFTSSIFYQLFSDCNIIWKSSQTCTLEFVTTTKLNLQLTFQSEKIVLIWAPKLYVEASASYSLQNKTIRTLEKEPFDKTLESCLNLNIWKLNIP